MGRHGRAGRAVGTRDANLTYHQSANPGQTSPVFSRILLAGTGYPSTSLGTGSEAEALVTAEFRPDGGVARTFYDRFGDARVLRNELHNSDSRVVNHATDEQRSYDAMGRLTSQTHRGALLTDYYAYDLLGQRIRHWNTQLGTGNVETTDYDNQGRVTKTVAFGGDATTHAYVWNASIATSGMETFGGWTQTTAYANSKTSSETTDTFGRTVARTDMGAHSYAYTFDKAGRLVTQTVGSETLTNSWFNTGLIAQVVDQAGHWAQYSYDEAGNRTAEKTSRWGSLIQDATATYDELGRMKSWAEAGTAVSPAASMSWEYDLNGNIVRTTSTHRMLDGNGTASSIATTYDHWYRFDAMNRVVTDKGVLIDGQIVRGGKGMDILYDAAGRRVSMTRDATVPGSRWAYLSTQGGWEIVPDGTGTDGQWTLVSSTHAGVRREDYAYDAVGRLHQVRVAESWVDPGQQPSQTTWPGPEPTVHPPPATGQLKATFDYDAMGRLAQQIDWLGNGADAGYDRTVTYNAAGQITGETVVSKQGSETWKSVVTNQYGTGSAYALGAATSTGTVDSKLSSGVWQQQHTTTTTNSYVWRDGAVQSSLTYAKTDQPTYTTTYNYSASGQLNSVTIADGRPRTVTFVNDMNGQAIRRSEEDNDYTKGDPYEIWYRFAGRQLGYVGNNGTLDTDYKSSIANRTKAPPSPQGPFRFGAATHTPYSSFDPSLEQINSYAQGGAGGSYTVRAGESLQSIAANLWGDASLWYKLAEANGMGAHNALIDGQRLTIPAGVQKNSHSASTFKPDDPSETLGETSPTNPKAPKKNKCGVMGAVLLAVIAVAVSVALPHLSSVFASTFGKVVGAMIGSAISQGVGVATDLQDNFSWKAIAMAGLSAGVPLGLEKVGAFNGLGIGGGSLAAQAARGAVSNAVTQGVGVATRLQSKFDWAGVAAAGAGSWAGAWAGKSFGGPVGQIRSPLLRDLAGAGLTVTADGVASAAAASLIRGTSFGDNLIAALPSVVGRTVGGVFSGALDRAAYRRQDRVQQEALAHAPGFENATPHAIAETSQLLLTIDRRSDRRYGVALDAIRSDPEGFAILGDLASGMYDPATPSHIQADRYVEVLRRGRAPLTAQQLQEVREAFQGFTPTAARPALPIGSFGPVVITGDRDNPNAFGYGPNIDPMLISAGKTGRHVAQFIADRPWLDWTLYGLRFVAAPALTLVGSLVNRVAGESIEEALARAADVVSRPLQEQRLGYTQGEISDAGAGGITLGGLILGAAATAMIGALGIWAGRSARRAGGERIGGFPRGTTLGSVLDDVNLLRGRSVDEVRQLVAQTGGGRWLEVRGNDGKSTIFREFQGYNRRGQPNLTGSYVEMNPFGTHHPGDYPYWVIRWNGEKSARVPAAGHPSLN